MCSFPFLIFVFNVSPHSSESFHPFRGHSFIVHVRHHQARKLERKNHRLQVPSLLGARGIKVGGGSYCCFYKRYLRIAFTMMPFVWSAAATLIGVYIYNYYRCFARNLAAAKQSGLPYVVAPVYGFNRFWLVTHRLWIPLLEKLPKSWTDPWLQYVRI